VLCSHTSVCVVFGFPPLLAQKVSVLVATSGDTGPAAIHAMKGKQWVECYVLFPQGGCSVSVCGGRAALLVFCVPERCGSL